MKKKQTNLRNRIHFFSDFKDMESQFSHDVEVTSKEFIAIVDQQFDMRNAWDQSVLAAILTNMLAYVEVYAELDGVNMMDTMKECFDLNLDEYHKQVKAYLK